MTLAEAHAALRAALPPGRNITIRAESHDYTHNDGRLTAEVSVWDGLAWHTHSTLATVVRECIEANSGTRPAPLAEAEAVLADVQVVESAA